MAKTKPKSDGERIRSMLDRAGLTQRAGAKALGIHERTMRKYISGELETPQLVKVALETLKPNSAGVVR